MNRVVIQEGYSLPFAGMRRRKRRSSGGKRKMQNKMSTCARKWKHSAKRGKYVSFMKSCLKSKR